jgi:hypothetical protein
MEKFKNKVTSWVNHCAQEQLDFLIELCNQNSYSYNKKGADRAAAMVVEGLAGVLPVHETRPGKEFGDHHVPKNSLLAASLPQPCWETVTPWKPCLSLKSTWPSMPSMPWVYSTLPGWISVWTPMDSSISWKSTPWPALIPPALLPFAHAAQVVGMSYTDLVNRMLDTAALRYFGQSYRVENGFLEEKETKRVEPLHIRVRSYLRSHLSTTLDHLEKMVSISSHVHDIEGVNELGSWISNRFQQLGFYRHIFPQTEVGNKRSWQGFAGTGSRDWQPVAGLG